ECLEPRAAGERGAAFGRAGVRNRSGRRADRRAIRAAQGRAARRLYRGGQRRAAAGARRRPQVVGDVADAGGHGLRRAQVGGGARHRVGVRSAADAARAAGGQHIRELPRGQPGAVASDAAATGGEDPERAERGAASVVPQAGAADRPRPSASAGRGPREIVGASERGGFPRARGEAGAAGDSGGEQIVNRQDMLAGLIAQAAAEGGELVTLRAVVEEASEIGARRALRRIGLGDKGAEEDIDELRELLAAWRAAKASAWKAVVGWVVR